MRREFLCGIALLFLAGGCASVGGSDGGSGELNYLQAVHRGEEPGEVTYLLEEPNTFRVGVASGDINPETSEYRTIKKIDQAARDSLAEMIRPWVVDTMEKYSRWFSWSERRPNSDYVNRQCEAISRTSVKVWDRFYYQIKKYQCVHVVHLAEVEITIIGEAIPRDHAKGGSDIHQLLNKMDQLQTQHAMVSNQLEMMRAP